MEWFKHKCSLHYAEASRLKFKERAAGYGIFMIILELLASSPNGKLELDYDFLGHTINAGADSGTIKRIINDYGLFKIYDDGFFSYADIDECVEQSDNKKQNARKAAIAKWEKEKQSKNNANAMQPHNNILCERNAEKSREEKSREDNNISISIKNDGGDSIKPLLPPPEEAKKESKEDKQNKLQLEADFNFFWTIYPKKQGKKDALRAYLKARKKASRDELLEALREVKAKDWKFRELQYVPHASTWLNQERWTDEVQEHQEPKKQGYDINEVLNSLDLDSNPFDGGN